MGSTKDLPMLSQRPKPPQLPSQKPKPKLTQPTYTPVLLTHTPALTDTHTPVLITDPTLSTRDLPMPSQRLMPNQKPKPKLNQLTLMVMAISDMVMATPVFTAVLTDTHMPTQHTDTDPIFSTRDLPMPRLRPSQLMVTDHMVTVIMHHTHVAMEDIM